MGGIFVQVFRQVNNLNSFKGAFLKAEGKINKANAGQKRK